MMMSLKFMLVLLITENIQSLLKILLPLKLAWCSQDKKPKTELKSPFDVTRHLKQRPLPQVRLAVKPTMKCARKCGLITRLRCGGGGMLNEDCEVNGIDVRLLNIFVMVDGVEPGLTVVVAVEPT